MVVLTRNSTQLVEETIIPHPPEGLSLENDSPMLWLWFAKWGHFNHIWKWFCIYKFVVKVNVYKSKRRPPLKKRVDSTVIITEVIRDVNAEELVGLDTNKEGLDPTIFFINLCFAYNFIFIF